MLKNYLKIACRNLQKNKVYSFINITGLAIGLAVCMLIMLYVGHESSYDQFHKNADRIVRMEGEFKMGNDNLSMQGMSYAMAPLTKQRIPFVEAFVRLRKENKSPVIQNPQLLTVKFSETSFVFADSNYFNFFSFKLVEGNKYQVLQSPFTVVISQKIAQKYFGKQDPVGKTILYNGTYRFTVTGISEKAPSNSSINYDFVASLSSLLSISETKYFAAQSQNVDFGSFNTYFLLKQIQDARRLEISVLQLAVTMNKDFDHSMRYVAIPITNIHLKTSNIEGANVKYVKIFPYVAALVLLLALINYMSLSTARSAIRAKEIGVRKVLGAGRKSIAMQFFIESVLYTCISFAVGYILCAVFQPVFFKFLQINVDNAFLLSPRMLLSFTILFIITVLFAAAYPSILLSAFKPVVVLYGRFGKKSGGVGIRKFFTIFQFSISILILTCGIVIDRQMYFFRHTDTGVNKENMIMIPFSQAIGKHYTAFKKEARSLASVSQTTTAQYPMYEMYDIFFTKAKDDNKDIALPVLNVDKEFISLLGLKWVIPPQDTSFNLSDNKVILNESAVRKLNLDTQPLNEKFAMGEKEFHVAGILKDFNYQSLQGRIGAMCICITKDKDTVSDWAETGGCLYAKIKPGVKTPAVVEQLRTIYERYDSTNPFEYYFMDDVYDAMYKAEDRLSKIFSGFTALMLVIAGLGLFGLSTFMALQRTKEVGIRKVLGASVSQITTLLSKDFVKLVLIAIIIASPTAWWAMNKWLEGFAYRINISWWMFALAAGIAASIALGTISFQAIKAAIANPVNSLRAE